MPETVEKGAVETAVVEGPRIAGTRIRVSGIPVRCREERFEEAKRRAVGDSMRFPPGSYIDHAVESGLDVRGHDAVDV